MSCFRVYQYCEADKTPLRCWVGDLAAKLGRLDVAGKILDLDSTKKFFTDSNLPLSGEASIIGHSIVVHDDHAPEHRGERMACTPIRRLYRHKACTHCFHTQRCVILTRNGGANSGLFANTIYYLSGISELFSFLS